LSINTTILIIAAACIISALFLTSEWDFKDKLNDDQYRDKPTGPRKGEKSDSAVANFSQLIDAIHYEGAANREEEKREDRGQRSRDNFTIMILSATLATLAITCWVLYRQVSEMQKVYGPIRESADAAKDQAGAAAGQVAVMQGQLDEIAAEHRPWVAVLNMQPSDSLTFSKPFGPILMVNVQISVSGQTMAGRVGILAKMFSIGLTNPFPTQEAMCKGSHDSAPLSPGSFYTEWTLFPGQVATIPTMVALEQEDQDFLERQHITTISPEIVGCAIYKDIHDGWHHTGFIYKLYRSDPRFQNGVRGLDTGGGDIPAHDLVLRPNDSGNGPAN
jgi:hypothetical protein